MSFPTVKHRAMLVPLAVLMCVGCARSQAVPMAETGPQGIVGVMSNTDAMAVFDEGAPRRLHAGKRSDFIQSPGPHRLEVRAPGYLTKRYDLDVKAKEALVIDVELWPSVDELDSE